MSSIAMPRVPTLTEPRHTEREAPGVTRQPAPVRPAATTTAADDARAWRRFLVVVVIVVAVVATAAAAFTSHLAEASVADRVDGHVMVEPGRTLWDVAVATAPTGVDPAQHLADIERLNAGTTGDPQSWRVVLLPAP